MALYSRVLGIEPGMPRIPAHVWPHLYQQYWGNAVTLTTLVETYSLSPENEDVSGVNVVTDRITLPFVYDWAEDDAVYLTTTGTLPTGYAAETIYYILNPNNGTGTTALSATKAGSAVNITGQGTGVTTARLIDPDIIHWEETRQNVTHTGAWDQKVGRFTWDQAAEGIIIIGANGIDHNNVTDLKAALLALSNRLKE